MPIVPLFGLGQTGKSVTVTRQRHLNLYAERQLENEKAPFVFYGTPGLTLRKSFGDTPVRGWIAVGDLYYLVHRGTFYSVNNAGTATSLGTLNTVAGRVDMDYDGTLILMVDGTNGYTFTISGSSFAQVSDPDFPNGARTCTWLDGQFVVDDGDSDQFFISPNGTAWDALDFATAESNPDGLVRVFSDNGEVVLAGTGTFEFWGNIGAADFPFAAIKGATQEFGLAARWSLCKFNSGIAGLLKPKGGQVQVMFIQGYVPKPISTQEVDSIINDYATVSDATAFSYMLGGHPMLQINFPSVEKSWLFDASVPMWTELEYGLNGARHRGEMHLDYLNKPIIADYSTGSIYDLDPNVYTDNGASIAREIVCRHFFNANDYVIADELYVDMEVGVGLTGNPESSGTNYLDLPGASGDYASTPDTAALDITGDIVIICYAEADDWTPAVEQRLCSKYSTAAGNRSYELLIGPSAIRLLWTADGTNSTGNASSTIPMPATNGDGAWLRVTMTSSTGNVVYDWSTDPVDTGVQNITWSQIGNNVGVGATSIFSGSASLMIGADNSGTVPFAGKIYKVFIYNATTLAAFFDATTTPTGSATVVATTGETYTLQGNASIDGDYVRATQGANPKAMLQFSKNNGKTWSSEIWATLGRIGAYLTRVIWRKFGISRDWTFKLRITDPVKVVITYAAMKIRV